MVGYYNGSAWVTLSGSDPDSYEVTTGQDGNPRGESLTAGSTGSTAIDLFMLKVNSAANGTVSGGTIYGDVYPSGTTVTLTAIPDSGYRFAQWNYVLGGSGVASTANPFALTLTNDVTLLPVFTLYTGFTVSYAGNGSTGGIVPAEQVVDSGGSATLAGTGTMVRIGYAFSGWNTRSDGNGMDYVSGAIYSGPGNLNLYAKWTLVPSPTITTSPSSQTVAVGATLNLSVAATGNSPLGYQWFKNGGRVLGGTNMTLTLANAGVTNSGVYYVVVTNALGMSISQPVTVTVGTPQLMAWGWNDNGQLGDGTVGVQYSPESVATNVVMAAGGLYHSLFVKGNNTLWAMGHNNVGQLGDGTTNDTYLPKSVASDVVTVTAGSSFSLFLKQNGSLWGMGYNGFGQLGDNTLIDRSNAVAVLGGTNVVAVTAGWRHALFLKGNGTLWAMGLNSDGQLGDGTTINQDTAVSVGSNVVAVVAGRTHSLYVKRDGTLWAMGDNSAGQLGDNTLFNRSNAVAVVGGSNVVAAAAGQYHSLFLKSDGTLWAMGDNAYGQLGDGTTSDSHLPKSVASNVVAVASGRGYSLFIKNDGSLWAMGTNTFGQLGDGTTTRRTSPVAVTGMALAHIIAGSSAHQTFGVGLPLLITTQPTNQTVVLGNNATFSVTASGIATVGYQWQFNGTNLSGSTSSSYTRTGTTAVQAGNYTVVITNLYGSITSSVAVLTVSKLTPNVTSWPTAATINFGQTLAASALSGGSASVPGSFAFTTPSTAPGAGTASQNVTFTPTDTDYYNTVGGTVSVTVNATGQAPVAVDDTLGTVKNRVVSNLSAAKLAANDTDAEGDPLTVIAVSATSTNGGTVTLVNGVVRYTPPSGVTGADSFTYTIADGHGNTATGTVLVTIASSSAVSLNIVYGPVKTDGEFVVRFAGTPGSEYTVEYSTNLTTWTWQANRTASITAGSFGRGVFEFRETTTATVRYFRTVYPAYVPVPPNN